MFKQILNQRWLLMSLLLAMQMALMSTPLIADVYYRLDFDSAKITSKGVSEKGREYRFRKEGGGMPGRIIKDQRNGSAVLELRSKPTPSGHSKDRAELEIYSGITFNRDWFYGFEVFLPTGVKMDETWQLLLQCHQNGTQKSPPISLNLDAGGNLVLISRRDADTYNPLWTGPMPKGRWVPVVLGFRMGEQGRARLWVDAKSVYDRRVPLGWSQGDRKCNLKTGIYRGESDQAFQVRLDKLALGDTYREVAPKK